MQKNSSILAPRLMGIGSAILRYSLVFFFVGFGLNKFTPQEAAGIQPWMANSLLLSWTYRIMDIQTASNFIGVIEIIIGLLIAVRKFRPAWSAYGSFGAAFALINTLSFLFTTPGLDPMSFEAGFLLKDLTLLGAALWTAGEAQAAADLVRRQNDT
jgi:reactive chlorine resistance protein C